MSEHADIDPIYAQVATVLRAGFRVAAALLVVGLAIALIRQEALAARADGFSEIPGALAELRARAFIDLAIIAIVLAPVAAVVTILRGFLAGGDTRFARYAAAVLAILAASIVLSLFQ